MNAEAFWMVLLKQLKQNTPGSQTLLHEMFTWCRVSEPKNLKQSYKYQTKSKLFDYLTLGNTREMPRTINAANRYHRILFGDEQH